MIPPAFKAYFSGFGKRIPFMKAIFLLKVFGIKHRPYNEINRVIFFDTYGWQIQNIFHTRDMPA